MPKLSKDALDARREEILKAAIRCFARRGIQATTMRDILNEVGLSTGAVYNYFRSKEDIIAAVVAHSSKATRDLLSGDRPVDGGAMTFRDMIDVLLDELGSAHHDGRAKMTKMIYSEAAVTPELLATVQRGRARIRALAREQVARMKPATTPAQQAELVDFVFLLYQGMVTEVALEESPNIDGMRKIIDLVLARYPPPQ